MSAGPTDRVRRRLAAALVLAAAALAAPAAAGDDPVFFRNPDPETAREISAAISLFGDPSPNTKERARDGLFRIGWWSVSRLLETVKERQGQFRTNSYLVLGRLGDRRALPAMRAEVLEDSEWPPAVAALMLGRMRDAEDPTMEAFGAVLRTDAGKNLRRQAVCLALAKLHRRRAADAVPLLEEALFRRTANPAVHHAALLSLGFFRGRIVEALPDGTGFQPRREIAEFLKSKDTGMRLSAILAMSISYIDAFHPHFLRACGDGDLQVRLVAMLAAGRKRDSDTTALLARVLEDPTADERERQMAAYLLGRRPDLVAGDPRAFDALSRAITAPRAPEVAAAALVALAGVEDERAAKVLVSKLSAASATARAAAAVGSVRLRAKADLERAREEIAARLRAGEPDDNARDDMKAAVEEIGAILADRDAAALGLAPKPRPPVAWKEADSRSLFLELGRDERQRTFDFVNLRALQVLGIESLLPYRPSYDPDEQAESLGGIGAKGLSIRVRPVNNQQSEQYDLAVELARRPYFHPEEDDPDAAPAPVPRESK